jgi:hypothetical protein
VGDNHTWRWVLFVACILLGRFFARTVVAVTIYSLDRLAASALVERDRGYLQSGIYYLHGGAGTQAINSCAGPTLRAVSDWWRQSW